VPLSLRVGLECFPLRPGNPGNSGCWGKRQPGTGESSRDAAAAQIQHVPIHWLTYRTGDRPVGVIVLEAPGSALPSRDSTRKPMVVVSLIKAGP
jgi:hypothetical protein